MVDHETDHKIEIDLVDDEMKNEMVNGEMVDGEKKEEMVNSDEINIESKVDLDGDINNPSHAGKKR